MTPKENWAAKVAEELLEDFSLEEILEMNDLEPVDSLEFLIINGQVTEPQAYFKGTDDEHF